MALLPMVEKTDYCNELVEWPLFYMNDFSVIGLLVSQLSKAASILEARGFQIIEYAAGVKIRFDDHRQIAQIIEALEAERIAFDLRDLVYGAYQG